MRRKVEEMVKREKKKNGVVFCTYRGKLFIDNFISALPRYKFIFSSRTYEKVSVVARVIGSTECRVVVVPEFNVREEELAILWFTYVRENGWVRGLLEEFE